MFVWNIWKFNTELSQSVCILIKFSWSVPHPCTLKKWSLKRGLPYLVSNQELKPLVPLPDYPPNKASPFERPFFEVTLCGLS